MRQSLLPLSFSLLVCLNCLGSAGTGRTARFRFVGNRAKGGREHVVEITRAHVSPTVAVVIPVFNRAAYLREALNSVFAQTRPADEVIVVDDGSDDDPTPVVSEFPGARLIRQANQGPSTARNAGIRAAKSEYVLCLDSDDVLVPDGIRNSLACMAENPGAAFVYGGYRKVDQALDPIDRACFRRLSHEPYRDLLGGNLVEMLGTVMFDRARLLGVGGFDPAISRCEDYDLFLRLARHHPVAGDPAIVAHYRIHEASLSAHADEMLVAALVARERNRPEGDDSEGLLAYRRGKGMLVRSFANGAWRADAQVSRVRKWQERRGMARIAPFASLAAAVWQFTRRHLPRPVERQIRRTLRRHAPQTGRVQMGDLNRTRPISRHFGYDRGTPIDRYYIEKFLSHHRLDISGRVLEVGDASYSRAFGSNISRQEVLHVRADHPGATIVGDLSRSGTLPEAGLDCMILTQTLHLIYDAPAAVREIWRGLRPGGVALVTVPGVASVDRGEFADTWFWSLTPLAARRVFADVFGAENVEVEAFGNVYAATCFLQGLAVEDVEPSWLDKYDASYPMIVGVRARRPDR